MMFHGQIIIYIAIYRALFLTFKLASFHISDLHTMSISLYIKYKRSMNMAQFQIIYGMSKYMLSWTVTQESVIKTMTISTSFQTALTHPRQVAHIELVFASTVWHRAREDCAFFRRHRSSSLGLRGRLARGDSASITFWCSWGWASSGLAFTFSSTTREDRVIQVSVSKVILHNNGRSSAIRLRRPYIQIFTILHIYKHKTLEQNFYIRLSKCLDFQYYQSQKNYTPSTQCALLNKLRSTKQVLDISQSPFFYSYYYSDKNYHTYINYVTGRFKELRSM